MNKKIVFEIVIGIVLSAVLILVWLFIFQRHEIGNDKPPENNPNLNACTEEAKICPDGSTVGRIGNDCEFAPCPQAAISESQENSDRKTGNNLGTYSTLKEYRENVDYSCRTGSDCVIKDVGNCCGYYPACVNVDSTVDKDFVRKACENEGLAGVCGFPSIDSCKCSLGMCKGI